MEEFMRRKIFQVALLIVILALMVPSVLPASENPVAGGQSSGSDARKYAGEWVGSFTTEGGETNKLSLSLRMDAKGQWSGAVKWVSPNGEQSADFISLQIAGGKMKGKIESPDGQVDITIEGQFQGDKLEGAYAVSPKGSTEIVDRGTWKVTKNVAAKTPR
jgi:hypothetical protein